MHLVVMINYNILVVNYFLNQATVRDNLNFKNLILVANSLWRTFANSKLELVIIVTQ